MEEDIPKLNPKSQGFVYDQFCKNPRKFWKTAEYWRDNHALLEEQIENISIFQKRRCFSSKPEKTVLNEMKKRLANRNQVQSEIFIDANYDLSI